MKGKDPKLSVIIPVYNEEKYIKECLDSILNQSFRDIEVICVDDGSTDNTVSILEEISSNDPRVTVIHQKNEYAGAARNRGLLCAKGEYVHFMDGDDWLEKDVYEEWYSIAKDQDADVCIGFYRSHDMITGKTENRGSSPSKDYLCVTNIQENARYFFYGAVVPWNKIYRRSFLIENNLKFEHIQCANDRSFYFKVVSKAKSIAIIRQRFVNYRMNVPGALTGEGRLQHFDCHFRSFETIWEWFKNDEKEIRLMALDICMLDMFAFYKKSMGTIYEKQVRGQLRTYFKNLDLSEFSEEIKTCRWYMHYLLLLTTEADDDATYREILHELNHKEEQLAELKKKGQEALKYKKQLSDIQHSISFRVGRIATFPLRKMRGCIRNYKEHGLAYTARYAIWYAKDRTLRFFHKQSVSKPLPWGLTKEKREKKIIVSLTSYPGRIHLVHKTIETLLQQTVKPDMVILWLAESQFPKKKHDLPKELLCLKKRGLTIDWCEDIRSYKKLIPTLRKYPDDIIVTADDDAYYDKRWLEKLWKSYQIYGDKYIHCHRITRFCYVDNHWYISSAGKIKYMLPTFLHKLVGLGGVLYPPHVLHEDVLDEDKFMNIAPTNDDIWFWAMAVLRGTRICSIEGAMPIPKSVEGSQDNGSLTSINDHGEKRFWIDFNSVVKEYPLFEVRMKNDYLIMHEIDIINRTPLAQKDEAYFGSLDQKLLRAELIDWYYKRTKHFLDLENPKSFNEKIQWMKLYDSTPLKTKLADKYLVREWIKERLGSRYLIPLLGVWNSFDEIDFDSLPEQFVLKTNHSSGWNAVIRDKSKMNKEELKERFDKWMSLNFAFRFGLELHYMNIPRKIIAEKYMADLDGDIFDYRCFCFGGQVKYIWVDIGSGTDRHKRSIFDAEWNLQNYHVNYPEISPIPQKPKRLQEMIRFAEKLSHPFAFVRVDFYLIGDQIYFGELTFTPQSGQGKWEYEEQNVEYGELIQLPNKKPIPQCEGVFKQDGI